LIERDEHSDQEEISGTTKCCKYVDEMHPFKVELLFCFRHLMTCVNAINIVHIYFSASPASGRVKIKLPSDKEKGDYSQEEKCNEIYFTTILYL